MRPSAAKQPCQVALHLQQTSSPLQQGKAAGKSASASVAGSHRFVAAEHVIQRPETKEEEQRYGSIVRILLRYLHGASTAGSVEGCTEVGSVSTSAAQNRWQTPPPGSPN